jgi:hypothetical protein
MSTVFVVGTIFPKYLKRLTFTKITLLITSVVSSLKNTARKFIFGW